jgi:hypothetical protein
MCAVEAQRCVDCVSVVFIRAATLRALFDASRRAWRSWTSCAPVDDRLTLSATTSETLADSPSGSDWRMGQLLNLAERRWASLPPETPSLIARASTRSRSAKTPPPQSGRNRPDRRRSTGEELTHITRHRTAGCVGLLLKHSLSVSRWRIAPLACGTWCLESAGAVPSSCCWFEGGGSCCRRG